MKEMAMTGGEGVRKKEENKKEGVHTKLPAGDFLFICGLRMAD